MTIKELVEEFKKHTFDELEELRDELDEVIVDKEIEDENEEPEDEEDEDKDDEE